MNASGAQKLNALCALILGGVLIGAYTFQLALRELPCPLCLLQRWAFLGVAFGAILNLRFGIRPSHYGFSLISALFGAAISGRQILLHITDPVGFGTPLWGMHIYSWAFVAFVSAVFLIGVMLLADGQFGENGKAVPRKSIWFWLPFGLLALLALANTISTFLECAWMTCPDNPTRYFLLP